MKARYITTGTAIVAATLCLCAADAARKNFYCKYCGYKTSSVKTLTANVCQRHPDGPGKGRHALYEGGEKTSYTCKFCGKSASDLRTLTGNKCMRHPNGPAKGRHQPAL